MILFDRAYTNAVRAISYNDFFHIVQLAWEEDTCSEDITSESIFDRCTKAKASVIAKEDGVLCGSSVLETFSYLFKNNFSYSLLKKDQDFFYKKETLFILNGNLVDILKIERILLNIVQYLSGIATQTHKIVQEYSKYGIKILDTRKTLPAYRKLSKYAVYCGGGNNHRLNLQDMALIKDNHIIENKSIQEIVKKVRTKYPKKLIEVEVQTLEQIEDAVQSDVDIILLDNFTIEKTKKAIQEIRNKKPSIFIECSGNITPEKLELFKQFAPIGVSLGYLTHTSRFLDLSMEIGRIQ